MKEFKKQAIAGAVSALLLSATAVDAHVAYNLNPSSANANAALGPWSDTVGTGTDYTGHLPVTWLAHVHNDSNPNSTYEVSKADSVLEGVSTYAPVPPATVGTPFAIESLSNRWSPANSWGNALDFGLIDLKAAGTLTITVAADATQASTFKPGFTLFSGWDTSPTSSKHGAWNVVLPAVPVNPRGSAGLAFVGQASTTVAGGTVSYTFVNLPAGKYSLWIGGAGVGTTTTGSQSYVTTIASSPTIPSIREDNDGDKHADILWYNPISVIAGAGSGDAYELLSDVGLPVPTSPITVLGQFAGVPIPSAYTIQGRGNYIPDSKADILWGNALNQLYIAQRVAASPAAYNILGPLACAPATSAVAGTGDFNGDNISDILLKDLTSGNVSVLLMSGFGATILNNPNAVGAIPACTATFAVPPTANSIVKGTGDYNGDGKADILWSNGTGQADVQYTGIAGTTNLSGLAGIDIQGSGNFDGDSGLKSDILLRNAAGDVSIKTDVQASPTTSGTPISFGGSSLIPTAWQVKGTGDYDGDGKNDILWRNTSATDPLSGYNYVFLMNGVTVRTAGTPSESDFLPSPYNNIPVSAGWDINYTQTQ